MILKTVNIQNSSFGDSFELKFYSHYDESIDNYLINEIFKDEIYNFHSDNNSPVILDCGSNIGLSLIYFKLKYPKSIIYAFEPDPAIFNVLKNNVAFHNFSDVTIFNKAVSDNNGTMTFFVCNKKTGYIPVGSIYKNTYATDEILVESIDIGEFIFKLNKIDFCKIDIEGGESLMLNSMIHSDSITNISNFIVEYHKWVNQTYKLNDFIETFKNHGFKSKIIKEEPPEKNYEKISGNAILNFQL